MENSESRVKYNVIEKYINGVDITKFAIETLDGTKRTTVSYDDTVKLARSGKLSNIGSIIDITKGDYILDYNGHLNEIPIHKQAEFTIKGRVINQENKCVGYKVTDCNGKVYKLSINKTWELAAIGSVKNIKAKFIGNKKVLVGLQDFKLSDIPKIIE